MVNKAQKTIDTTQNDSGIVVSKEEVKPGSSALSKLSRELPASALKNPYVGKLLLNRIDEYETEVSELKGYRSRFHEADKKAATLQERLETSESSVGVRAALSALGGITTGSLFALWPYPQFFWGMVIVSGTLFFLAYLGPLLVKFFKRKIT